MVEKQVCYLVGREIPSPVLRRLIVVQPIRSSSLSKNPLIIRSFRRSLQNRCQADNGKFHKGTKNYLWTDRNLGNSINSVINRELLLWNGACHVYE